jgi:hypothetical protein
MDYPLAKELKDAGFPQGGRGRWIVDPGLIVVRGGDRAYIPTLEELIEACGDIDLRIDRRNKRVLKWESKAMFTDGRNTALGSTPSSAVARLWLALKK